MKTIRAIFQEGTIKPLDPVDLPENTRLTVALFDDGSTVAVNAAPSAAAGKDEVPAAAIASLSQGDPAFDFLNDPREDVYTESDGEAV